MSLSQLTPRSAYENTELSANVPVGSYRAETPHLLWLKVLMQGLFFFFSTPDLRDPLCTCTNTDWQSMCPFAIHLSVLAPSCRLIHHVKWCRLKLCGLGLWHTAGHQKSRVQVAYAISHLKATDNWERKESQDYSDRFIKNLCSLVPSCFCDIWAEPC